MLNCINFYGDRVNFVQEVKTVLKDGREVLLL